ncbi:MAG: hypothetical protein U1F77_14500 [Kiritimatiellia bacterium]
MREIFAALPPDVTRALQDPPGACAVVLRAADLERGRRARPADRNPAAHAGPQGLARERQSGWSATCWSFPRRRGCR